ncbi:6-phospho-3-hexuloisomerase [Enterococcus sp. HY326]|uniref:6-phospho-3-hexuloisomerase n=1 Tax=Enterococcus sp. HY326 TaxID=2971265 RepID=UPI0022401BE8|nr:6-phospho-3-hexuloisomerase [Enterococcus sp. HY326]
MKDMEIILKEIDQVIAKLNPEEVQAAIDLLNQNQRIFVLGEGRSGLQGKGFAMRLMHIGLPVYVIGETTTPSVQAGDLLVAISGSGTTSAIVSLTTKAKAQGVTILAVTSKGDSPLGELGDVTLVIPGATKTKSGLPSIQLLSSLFDQTLHITLDYICLQLSKLKNVSNEAANQQHSNME